ncbi:MAG: valine--tRNA ligase [Candidatus Paceibacterota bacterium]
MDKRFDYQNKEKEIYNLWEEEGYFNPEKCVEKGVTKEDAEPFSMVLPPPNVTGVLHMGHAAMLAIEDVMTRYNRMQGKKTLWIPGTDHAAIATQSKVEKLIYKKEKKNRHDLGREKFLEEVNKFAKESHDTIESQIKAMGASLDWSREAFTLDDKRSYAVKHAFKKMYEDGLIYRGNRIVNWDPKGQTTVSDDEVDHIETEGVLYTFKYSKDFPITIATTRPETKFGDVAVAVNPDDKRYKEYIGKEYKIDFLGKELNIKVVGDDVVDPEFGTGAVGVTPAHSFTDFEIAERHNLEVVQVINEYAKMELEGHEVDGMKTKDARLWVAEKLKELGLLKKQEKIKQNISKAERTGGVIEPLPKLQWFIDVNKEFEIGENKINIKSGTKVTLKHLMKHVVESNQVEILPERFKKVYFHWIDNLRDWCISRQIWYGHRIPVWYKGDEVHAETDTPSEDGWEQDKDTLDTWFSSGLWTFSTLGWPEETEDLKTYHPTTILETGHEIIFFWVARMILMTTYFLGEIPFKTVYLHGIVRDKQGRKMSKSLDNSVNPLDMIKKYGADATRLSSIIGAGPGNDIVFSEQKVKSYRNFSTKIWNVARFLEMNKPENYNRAEAENNLNEKDKEKIKKAEKIKEKVSKHIEEFNFHLAGEEAYDFLWNDFANNLLEETKLRLDDKNDIEDKRSAYRMLEKIFFESIKMLHPFIPFVTEAVYDELNLGDKMLMIERW